MEQHKLCEIKHQRIDERIESNLKRLNRYGERLDVIEQDIIAQKKDTTHLQDVIKDLKRSIDALIEGIGELKSKPLEKYEKVAMVIIAAIISYIIGRYK